MQILVHLGLNKCASSYVQQALAAAQGPLRRAGVFYAVEGGRTAQYGLSRHYGFGPEAPGLTPRSLGWLASEARRRGCGRMIVSSEYLSLGRPGAIAAFAADVAALGAEARYLLVTRPVEPWLRSLFNQYVKTVDQGRYFANINAFIDHVLSNGAADLAGRCRAWVSAVGPGPITHLRIACGSAQDTVLEPFAAFAGMRIPPPSMPLPNAGLAPGALYLTGLLRQAPPSPGRDSLIAAIAGQDCAWVPVPEDYLHIDPVRAAALHERVSQPLERLVRTFGASRQAA